LSLSPPAASGVILFYFILKNYINIFLKIKILKFLFRKLDDFRLSPKANSKNCPKKNAVLHAFNIL
jgi:hypothetical protein